MERKRALESLIFIVETRDGKIKARHCANGRPQREWMSREDVSSPTVSTEATMLTSVIEAEEGRDVATCDIPNPFIQTEIQPKGTPPVVCIRFEDLGVDHATSTPCLEGQKWTPDRLSSSCSDGRRVDAS